MEHIEAAGVHSGDSACVLPPHSISLLHQQEIERQTKALARELGVVGLMNIQFAVKDGEVYIIEVNPRASRTAPFVSKATGVPLAKLATRVMMGEKLADLKPWKLRKSGHISIKESVFPFNRFPGVDILLGPEMRSTGEVMGISKTFGLAFVRSQNAAGQFLPYEGNVFISVKDTDKEQVLPVAKTYEDLGFTILATRGTADFLSERGVKVQTVLKVYEGRPNIVDLIKNGDVQLLINTASGKKTIHDSKAIRQVALLYGVPYTTTMAGAIATSYAVKELIEVEYHEVRSLQEYYGQS